MYRYDSNEAIQSLYKSNFFLFNDCLLKQDENGNAIAHFKLDEIDNISSARKVSGMALFFIGLGILTAVPAHFFIQSQVWTIVTYILGGLSLSIGLLALMDNVLVLDTGGENINYTIREDKSDLKGFVVSVRQYKNSYKSKENRVVYRNL